MQATSQRNRAARIPTTFFERIREREQNHLPSGPPAALSGGIGLAHDAANLLGALRLYADLLSAPDVLQPRHKHYATEIRGIVARSTSLLRSLMEETGDDSTGIPAQSVGCPCCIFTSTEVRDLAGALAEWVPVLQRMAGEAAKVSASKPRQLCVAMPSLEAVERITTNLVANAAAAIASQQREHPGQIKVSLRVSGQKLRLRVVDDGPGMPAGAVGELLRSGLTPRGTRHGIGHRVVHELARATGGHLAVISRPGEGTSVSVEWQLHIAQGDGGQKCSTPLLAGNKLAGNKTRAC